MKLWFEVLKKIKPLRAACSRSMTFFNLCLCVMGMCGNPDGMGVTSIMRSLCLKPKVYTRLLGLFNGSGVDLKALRSLWVQIVRRTFNAEITSSGRVVFIVDGTDIAKSGRKMPGVHLLHNHSGSKQLPQFYMGHSFQAISLLAKSGEDCVAVPLSTTMDDGLVFSNRDQRTKLDHAIDGFSEARKQFPQKGVFLADAAYGAGKVIEALDAHGDVLLTRCKNNVTAYLSPEAPATKKRGRPKTYGKKVRLSDLFEREHKFTAIPSPVYGETDVEVRIFEENLLWRSARRMVKFVLVSHPNRGRVILLTTDLEMPASEVIRLYGLRFKIEVAFKVAKRVVGAFSYRFWFKDMERLSRKSGSQHLHHKSDEYREMVRTKVKASHVFVQLACIAQGLLQYLSLYHSAAVWTSFRGWLRTMRPSQKPSEQIVAMALSSSFPEFIQGAQDVDVEQKYLLELVDYSRLGVSEPEERLCA